MVSTENPDYDKLVQTIDSMLELVAAADGRFMLYGEQCKKMVHEFRAMRDSMSVGQPDAKSTPILRELFRMACGAMIVLESCSSINQTLWLQAALIQDDKTVFDNIRAGLKWGFTIFTRVGSNSSTREPFSNVELGTDDLTLFNNDQRHLKEELHRVITEAPELDRLIATFLLARLIHTNEGAESMYFAEHVDSWPPWDPTNSDNNNLSNPALATTVQAIRWFGVKLARKLFPPETLVAFLQKEISIMAKLKHPNVVRFISSSRNTRAIVMECMEMNLDDYLKERVCINNVPGGFMRCIDEGISNAPFGNARDGPQMLIAVDIMYQISSGMEYLHSQPHYVAHLDLKPPNILVNQCKGLISDLVNIEEEFKGFVHVKIADMGLSKLGSTDDLLIRNSNPRLGTTLWQAPETYTKGRFVCMQKADLYAFGIICWEILHGREPRLDPNMRISEHRQEVKRGRRLEINPDLCPPYLERIIQNCWHRNPNRRPSFSTCSLALQSYKAMLLGCGKESLLDITVAPETLEEKVKRLWNILIRRVMKR